MENQKNGLTLFFFDMVFIIIYIFKTSHTTNTQWKTFHLLPIAYVPGLPTTLYCTYSVYKEHIRKTEIDMPTKVTASEDTTIFGLQKKIVKWAELRNSAWTIFYNNHALLPLFAFLAVEFLKIYVPWHILYTVHSLLHWMFWYDAIVLKL